VLPNGDVVRTGMGALPGANTWAEYRYGFGPTVDGLFAQGNLGIVTKMGFHLLPAPDAYQTSTVSVPRRRDIVPLVDLVNELEHGALIGMPEYFSPLGGFGRAGPPSQEVAELLKKAGGPTDEDFDRYARQRNLGSWSCRLQFYGSPKVIAAHLEHAKDRFTSVVPGSTFQDGELLRFPLTQEQLDRVHKVAVGIPNMSIFSIGARTELNPSPSDGHLWFSPIIPKTGEAVLEAQRVFMEAFARLGMPSMVSPFSMPATWMHRAFIFIMAFPISRTNVAQNQRNRAAFRELVKVAAEHGWGEYRTAPAFQDDVMAAYSFNNRALLRLHETIKDAVDPNGIVAAGRSGIWPRHLRRSRG
jgi:4-cresol dehydrogenase (hydroxylating)